MASAGTSIPAESEVVPVPPEVVEKLWKDVRRIIHSRYRASTRPLADYDDERLHGRLLLGRDIAWLVIRPTKFKPLIGVILTSITERPPSTRQKVFSRERCLTVHLAGGHGIESWIEMAAERITTYGQIHGCRQLFILARKGWQKYVDYFHNRGWDKVAYSRDRPIANGGRRLRNRVGYYRVSDPPEVNREPFKFQRRWRRR